MKNGMVTEFNEINSPEESYRLAINMVQQSKEGNIEELQDQIGNSLCVYFDEGFRIVGVCETTNKILYPFITDGNVLRIYKVIECNKTLVIELPFLYDKPIKCEYRIVNDLEFIYFYDGFNPDRFICLSKPEIHYNGSTLIESSFLLDPEFLRSTSLITGIIDQGGDLPYGSYCFTYGYRDDLNNFIGWSNLSIPVPITALGISSNVVTLEGSIETSHKGLNCIIKDLDNRYPKVDIAVIRWINEFTPECFIYNTYEIVGKTDLSFSITSLNNKVTTTYDELTIPLAKYYASKTMIQQDNRLIRGNLKEKTYDWGKFQIEANNIQVQWHEYGVKEQSQFADYDTYDSYSGVELDPGITSAYYTSGIKNSFVYQHKSFMRDEVYSLGIKWIMKNGTESPSFHISGRPKDYYYDNTSIGNGGGDFNTHNRLPSYTNWDSDTYPVSSYSDADIYQNITSTFERWQVYNTAFNDGTNKLLGYYECRDLLNNPILYPATKDCDGNYIYPHYTIDNYTYMYPIRHHRMPDTTLSPLKYKFTDRIILMGLNFSNITVPETYYQDVIGFKIVIGDREADKTILDKGILTTILTQKYNTTLTDTVTENNKKLVTHNINSMQFSHDNQSPKSYTLETSPSFNVPLSGGDQAFICLPACADTIPYQQENCEQIGDEPVITNHTMVAYHSPLSKLRGQSIQGTHVKFERELTTELNSGVDPTMNFIPFNNRRRIKHRETKNILTTNVYQKFKCDDEYSCIPESLLTNRQIKSNAFINTDSTYEGINNSLTINTNFVNKTQQELITYELSGSHDAYDTYSEYVEDKNCVYGTLFVPSGYPITTRRAEWCRPNIYTRAYNSAVAVFNSSVEDIISKEGGKMSLNYVSVKNLKTDCYFDLEKINYREYNSNIYPYEEQVNNLNYYGGDIFINRFAFKRSFYGYVPHAGNMNEKGIFGSSHEGFVDAGFVYDYGAEHIGLQTFHDDNLQTEAAVNAVFESQVIDTYYESEINMEFREHDDTVFNNNFFEDTSGQNQPMAYNPANATVKTNLFYPKYYGEAAKELLMLEINANAFSRLTDQGEWKYYQMFPNYYKLNDAYNVKHNGTVSKPLPNTFNFCRSGDYENRLIWSDKSYYEDLNDRYRIFRVNNYLDISANTGEINDIFEHKNQLYLNTKTSMYQLPKTNEQISLADKNIYIGTGTYLSLPPIRLVNMNYNYGGNQGRFNRISTEHGIFFVNQLEGVITRMGLGEKEGMDIITSNMQHWFYENLPYKMNQLFLEQTQTEYPYMDDFYSNYGISLTTTFDYKFKYLFIHKKDFEPLLPITLDLMQLNTENLFFDGTAFYALIDEVQTKVYFSDSIYFANKSFTVSYDVIGKKWISFYSWQPDYMFNDGTSYYTSFYDAIWIHNKGNQREYYFGEPSPAYIEWQVDKGRNITDSIMYYMKTQQYNSTTKRWIDTNDNFYGGFLYNTYQTTGEFFIVENAYNQATWPYKACVTREGVRKINNLRQMNTDENVLTEEWGALQGFYSGYQGFMPYTVVPVTDMSYFTQYPLRDTNAYARFWFNTPNTRMRFQFSETNSYPTIR